METNARRSSHDDGASESEHTTGTVFAVLTDLTLQIAPNFRLPVEASNGDWVFVDKGWGGTAFRRALLLQLVGLAIALFVLAAAFTFHGISIDVPVVFVCLGLGLLVVVMFGWRRFPFRRLVVFSDGSFEVVKCSRSGWRGAHILRSGPACASVCRVRFWQLRNPIEAWALVLESPSGRYLYAARRDLEAVVQDSLCLPPMLREKSLQLGPRILTLRSPLDLDLRVLANY